MAKKVRATKWEVIIQDETGALINIDYKCPYCGFDTGNFISIGASSVSIINGPWETDQTCPVCDKDVIIQCR